MEKSDVTKKFKHIQINKKCNKIIKTINNKIMGYFK